MINLTIENAKELHWCDKEHTRFDCTAKFAEIDKEIPCTVSGDDNYPHIKQLWQRGLAGEFGTIAEKE